MKRAFYYLAVFVGVAASIWCPTSNAGDKLIPLADDLSRGDLFQRFIANKANEEIPGGHFLPGLFEFPKDTTFDYHLNEARKNTHFGIDISHYTGRIDFSALRSKNVMFVYAKASQGTSYFDDHFGAFWTKLGSLPVTSKIKRGAYHFLSAGLDGAQQAQVFIEIVNANGGMTKDDLPPVIDLEWDIRRGSKRDAWEGHNADEIITQVREWLHYVEKATGRSPVIYTSRSWWRDRHIPDERIAELAPYRIWIADYSLSGKASEMPHVPANVRWNLWQFSDHAKVTGAYDGFLDANIFKGSAEDLEEFATK